MSEDGDIRIKGLLETVYVDEEPVRVVPDSWYLTQLLVFSATSPGRPNFWTPSGCSHFARRPGRSGRAGSRAPAPRPGPDSGSRRRRGPWRL